MTNRMIPILTIINLSLAITYLITQDILLILLEIFLLAIIVILLLSKHSEISKKYLDLLEHTIEDRKKRFTLFDEISIIQNKMIEDLGVITSDELIEYFILVNAVIEIELDSNLTDKYIKY